MPEIRIQYFDGELTPADLGVLRMLLEDECCRRFSVGELQLRPSDFGIIVEPLNHQSAQSFDVVIRITLHAFSERLTDADTNARELAAAIKELLARKYSDTGRTFKTRAVGVSLVFAEIAWASA